MSNSRKIIDIDPDSKDAPGFINIIESIVNNYILDYRIDEISLVKIDNWFDHKWLNYSGKGIIHFEQTPHPDKVAITNFWKDKITLPPFNPKRVLSSMIYRKKGHSNPSFEKINHKEQRSTENLDNYLASKSENGLLVWFSSNSVINQKGSIMLYWIHSESVDTFYASIENKNGWTISQTKGINRKTLMNKIN